MVVFFKNETLDWPLIETPLTSSSFEKNNIAQALYLALGVCVFIRINADNLTLGIRTEEAMKINMKYSQTSVKESV